MTTENENIGGILGVTTNGKKWRKRAIWLLVLLLACAAALWALNKWQSAPAAPTVRYRTEKATTGDLTVTVTATGQLQPTKTVEVGSEVSGIIDAVLVDYNDRVKAGQVLARINTEKLDAQVLQDKAAV
ncbi:MAG TPA: biotin/lipoyl-binding protein, partial [Bryobacteraceae bacterium]|nr:biotin/lipoyl-binding protein [Bryobacteraceae bacterium]